MTRRIGIFILGCVLPVWSSGGAAAQERQLALVPGTGTKIDYVGDDLENPAWRFIHNHPKSSYKTDDRHRLPGGYSENDRWFEGIERGQPDVLKVIPTPAGGISGSQFALLTQTLHSGIPGFTSGRVEQDDLVVSNVNRIGTVPVRESPSVVARVYLPPAEQWEQRSGPHFGFRVQVTTTVRKSEQVGAGRFRSSSRTYNALEPYWPGIWVHLVSPADGKTKTASAFLTVRGDRLGHDFKVKEIPAEEFGWWTFGMSLTPNGMVHYFARPGVDALTEGDHLTSQFPYGYRAEQFESMFFNVCNRNDGRTWSTAFVIDDPSFYLVQADRVNSLVVRKEQAAARQAARRSAAPHR